MSVVIKVCQCCGKPVGQGKIWMTHLAGHAKEGNEWAKKELAVIEQLVAFRKRQREQTSGVTVQSAKPIEIKAIKIPRSQVVKFQAKSRGSRIDQISKYMALCLGRVYKNLSYHQAEKAFAQWDLGPDQFEEFAGKMLREARRGLRSLKKLRKLNAERRTASSTECDACPRNVTQDEA